MDANMRLDRNALRRVRRCATAATAALVVACCLTLPGVATAAAAPASPSGSGARSALPTLEVELWPDRQQGLTSLTVLARLPEKASLPATVRIPLPEGATITWSGEIDVADTSGASDSSQTAKIVRLAGGRAVSLVARKSRLVQYEAVLSPSKHEGTKVTTVLDWIQTVPTGSVTFSTRVPIDATQVQVTPSPTGDPQKNDQIGQMLYSLAPKILAPGQLFAFRVVYEQAAAGQAAQGAPPSGGASSGPWGIPVWLLLLLVVAIAMLPVVIGMQRRRQAAAAGGDAPVDPEDGTGEDPEDGTDDDDPGDGSDDDAPVPRGRG
jgi:hypothetical protein